MIRELDARASSRRRARPWAGRCRRGPLLAFEGDLGAGKTTFIQAIARGLGVEVPATSPTYALVHRYRGRRGPVFHLDCYRLRSPDEAADLDWEGLLAEGDAILVEWPERAGRLAACARSAVPAASPRRPVPRGSRGAVMRLAIETATDRASVALGAPRRMRSSSS